MLSPIRHRDGWPSARDSSKGIGEAPASGNYYARPVIGVSRRSPRLFLAEYPRSDVSQQRSSRGVSDLRALISTSIRTFSEAFSPLDIILARKSVSSRASERDRERAVHARRVATYPPAIDLNASAESRRNGGHRVRSASRLRPARRKSIPRAITEP